MKKWKWVALVLAATLCIGSASAHPGRTDANGGHYNHSTGEYHYHHGYPAHQHIDGVCPYDYDDRTGWNSGTSSGSSAGSSSYGRPYNNGNLTTDQVKELQEYYGVTQDGKWGQNSMEAAGGLSADEAWNETFGQGSMPNLRDVVGKIEQAKEPGTDVAATITEHPQKTGMDFEGKILIAFLLFVFFVIYGPLILAPIIGGLIAWLGFLKPRVKKEPEPQAPPKQIGPKQKPVQPPMRTISKEERDHMIQADAYWEMCGGRSIREMAEVPENVYFDTFDRPNTLNRDPPEDPFFVYVTKKGESYHLRTCRLAKNASPMNICQAMAEGKQPCKLCRPMEKLPDFAVRYRELKRIQREYGVYMLP